jgi:hypothetical protein
MPSESKEGSDGGKESEGIEMDLLLVCCNDLEDLLLDDIMPADLYLGDDDTPPDFASAESKAQEETMFSLVRAVCKEALPSFVEAVQNEMSVGEYTLEHQQFHAKFLELIETRLEDKLMERGVSLRAFVSALRATLNENDFAESDAVMMFATAKELLDVIDCVEKFTNFAEGMRIKALQYLSWKEEGDDAWMYGRR